MIYIFNDLNVKRHEFSHVCIWFDAIRCSSFVVRVLVVSCYFRYFLFFVCVLCQVSRKEALWEYHIHLIEPETRNPQTKNLFILWVSKWIGSMVRWLDEQSVATLTSKLLPNEPYFVEWKEMAMRRSATTWITIWTL